MLGQATLLEIGSNTVTVANVYDRFTLDKTNVMLVLLKVTRLHPQRVVPSESASHAAKFHCCANVQCQANNQSLGDDGKHPRLGD